MQSCQKGHKLASLSIHIFFLAYERTIPLMLAILKQYIPFQAQSLDKRDHQLAKLHLRSLKNLDPISTANTPEMCS